MYDVDEKKLQAALEAIRRDRVLFNDALNEGWKPDFQKAIEQWHTVCLELDIGEGYVDHILEKHPEADLIECIDSILEGQADEFLCGGKDDPKDYRLLEIDTELKWIVNSYPVTEMDLQRARLYKFHGDSVRSQHCLLIIATPISLGMQGPGDVPRYNVPEYNENQIVGVQYDCEKDYKERATANANRWRKALGL